MVSVSKKLCLVALLGVSTTASALTHTVTSGSFSSQAGAFTVDFGVSPINNTGPVAGSSTPNSLLLSGSGGGVTYSYTDGALFNFDGSSSLPSGVSARPVGSTGNFWSIGVTPDTQDGPGIVNLGAGVSYYGFLWGSPDASGWNTVSFYDGNTLLGSFDGSAILVPPNGDQTYAKYFNVFAGPGEVITSISFAANRNAFETDNHAFISAVPEPEIYAMMGLGLGLVGWVGRRRRAQAAA
ncbi:MAG: PEP-CTERM sorting domain-containing protein [Burkholderiales bacterium]